MTRPIFSFAAGLLALSGCAPSNDLSNEEHVRTWANAASALGVFAHGYEALATADAQDTFPDPACPAIEDDGTTLVITGECTNSAGRAYYGTATVVRSGGDRAVTFDGYGGDVDGAPATLTGTMEVTQETDGSHTFVADYVHTGGVTTSYDYTGSVIGTYDGPTTWSGSGTVERDGVVAPEGVVEATTVAEVVDNSVCEGRPASGTTTLEAEGRTAVITYRGATSCDDATGAEWALDGEAQGPISGIVCSVSRGARGSATVGVAFLLAAVVALRLRRRTNRRS